MNIWTRNGNYVSVLGPGPEDLFVVTMVDGKRYAIQPVSEYSSALDIAEKLAEQISSPVKLMALSLNEVLAFTGVSLVDLAAGLTTEDDERAITACREVLRECNDRGLRAQAEEVLVSMGAISKQ